MCLAKFECPKINMKILMSGFHELRYLDLFNQIAEIFFKAPVEQRQTTDGKMITAHWGITWNEDHIYATHQRFLEKKLIQQILVSIKIVNYWDRFLFLIICLREDTKFNIVKDIYT